MPHLLLYAEFEDTSTPPEGDPPTLSVRGESTRIVALGGEEAPQHAVFESSVTMTGETAFLESGRMVFDDSEDGILFGSTNEGFLGPSLEPGLLQGAVIWRVSVGDGRFAGVEGLITSNFVMRAETGKVAEKQVISLFLP
jgi:hypothetical protein